MKLSDMVPLDTVSAEHRRDPKLREMWDRAEFGRRVVIALVRYRVSHNLTED